MVAASYNSNTSTVLIGVNDSFYTETETGTMYNSTANVEIGRRSGVGQYYPANIASCFNLQPRTNRRRNPPKLLIDEGALRMSLNHSPSIVTDGLVLVLRCCQ